MIRKGSKVATYKLHRYIVKETRGGDGWYPSVAKGLLSSTYRADSRMDGNKDDAARCAEIGETAFKNGDYNKAMKFLGKAQKLYPSNSVSAGVTTDVVLLYNKLQYRGISSTPLFRP